MRVLRTRLFRHGGLNMPKTTKEIYKCVHDNLHKPEVLNIMNDLWFSQSEVEQLKKAIYKLNFLERTSESYNGIGKPKYVKWIRLKDVISVFAHFGLDDSNKTTEGHKLKMRLDESAGNKSEKTPIASRGDESTSVSLPSTEQSVGVDIPSKPYPFNGNGGYLGSEVKK